MTAFGIAGRARGQQELCDRVRTDRLMDGIEPRVKRRRHQIRQLGHDAARDRTAAGRDFGTKRNIGRQRLGKLVGVIGEDEARRQQFHEVAELAKIPRYQRIGRRYRAERHAGIERAESEQGVINGVAGQNDDRLLGRQAAREQCGGDMPARLQQLRVGDLAPAALRIALGHVYAVRLDFGPMMQAVGDAARIIAEFCLGAEIDGAVVAAFHRDIGVAERYRAQRMRGGTLV